MDRNDIQEQALSLIKSNDRVLLNWCTSLGKSRAAIEIANYLQENKEVGNIRMLVIVAEIAHIDNWKKEFSKWKLDKNIVFYIACYASLKKYEGEYDFIIFDEAHHLGSELRLNLLEQISAPKILFLTATMPYDTLQNLRFIYGNIEVSKVSLSDAIEEGILPEPQIYLIPLELDREHYNQTLLIEWGSRNKRIPLECKWEQRWLYMRDKKKYPNASLTVKCTEFQKYNYYEEQFEFWKRRYMLCRQEYMKNKWLQSGSNRKRFLGDIKTPYVIKLLDKLKDNRFICFCSSIAQAEVLGKANSIHSKKANPLGTIDDFNAKKISSLFAVGMLQEGQNLVDIDAGIIVQLDGKERAFIQKFGRSMRSENPIQFIFYYKGTRDNEYLDKVLEGIDYNYVYYLDSFDEIEI